ncbi:hypothetical protein QR680_008219 [Steinernema hermaphroditum]|uniref:LTD domain-containing protein n=1 Tax=Steinernema hermaphroditum TaxID=289476 RepID=A0AA39IFU0_9BILA|nr:hypothetical protein QR680_008219 [Steinernema hermaphroditum]
MATRKTTTRSAASRYSTASQQISVDTDNNDSMTSDIGNISVPLSPTRRSRQQEKEHLSSLNNRLALYIERVRSLESQNSQLKMQIKDVEVVERKERNNLIARYQEKIDELRKTLDDVCTEKARLEIERSKAVEGYDELKAKVSKLEKDLNASDRDRLNCQSLVQDLQARLNTAENRRKHAEDESTVLRGENNDLKRQLETLRREIEDEAVLRTTLENKLITLKEDLDFARKTHVSQMDEVKRKRQLEMTSVSNEIETRYQAQLQEQLQAMRADFDARIAQNRREIDELYKSKLSDANETASRGRSSAGEAREEAARARLRVHELETVLSSHNKQVDELNRKIADLESALQRSRDEMNIKVSQRDEQIVDLEREIGRMISEYRDLMDLKVQLDVELQAYQKLLEGEESRLHMSPSSSPNVSQDFAAGDAASSLLESATRGVKRKRFANTSSDYSYDHTTKRYRCSAFADGDIAIDEVDTEGRHVRLKNKGDSDVSIGGWRVKSIGGGQEVVYKFHPRQMLKAGESITIWSKDSGEKHEPPHSLVMKNQVWPTGDDLRTGIQDTESKTVAGMENVLEYGSRTIDNGTDPDQRCSIM